MTWRRSCFSIHTVVSSHCCRFIIFYFALSLYLSLSLFLPLPCCRLLFFHAIVKQKHSPSLFCLFSMLVDFGKKIPKKKTIINTMHQNRVKWKPAATVSLRKIVALTSSMIRTMTNRTHSPFVFCINVQTQTICPSIGHLELVHFFRSRLLIDDCLRASPFTFIMCVYCFDWHAFSFPPSFYSVAINENTQQEQQR